MPIRFENLPLLLNSMREQGWIIDSFPFTYNNVNTIVILKLYLTEKEKPNQYAVAKLEFIDRNDATHSIVAYCDFYEVKFNNLDEFCRFFHINRGDNNAFRAMFIAFAEHFSQFIPNEVNNNKPELERIYMGMRAEGSNPNAIYCYDVKRTGHTTNGTLKTRSLENSNKARILRSDLYERYKDDPNLSFFFSDKRNKERTDEQIIAQVAARA